MGRREEKVEGTGGERSHVCGHRILEEVVTGGEMGGGKEKERAGGHPVPSNQDTRAYVRTEEKWGSPPSLKDTDPAAS